MYIFRNLFQVSGTYKDTVEKGLNHQTIAKQKNATLCLRLFFCITTMELDVAHVQACFVCAAHVNVASSLSLCISCSVHRLYFTLYIWQMGSYALSDP